MTVQGVGRRIGLALLATAGLASGCAAPTVHSVVARRCEDTRFPIYFQEGSDQLTSAGRAVIAAQAHRLGPCRIGAAEVLGLADADGSAAASLELSQRRASVVAQALAQAGLPAPSFDLQAQGAAGAVTASGRKAPLHRRAEVVLHAAPAS